MENGFLQLPALSPCFLWNQQAPRGVEGLEVGAGVWDLHEGGVSGGRAREETVVTCNDSFSISERRLTKKEEIQLW